MHPPVHPPVPPSAHPSSAPPGMIELATEHRFAGDWPGAFEAAYVTVAPTVDDLHRHYGSRFAKTVEAELRHMIPDLLRWHLPRHPDTGVLVPDMCYPLTLLRDDYVLFARTPMAHQPQRVTLGIDALDRLARPRTDLRLFQLRDRWDARRTGELLTRCGGPGFLASRPLLLDESGRHAEAWAAAGFDLRVLLFDERWGRARTDPAAWTDPSRRARAVDQSLAWLRPAFAFLPEATRRAADATGLVRIDLRGRRLVLEAGGPRAWLLNGAPAARAETEEFGVELSRVPSMPLAHARRPPELTALLRGELGPGDLHPVTFETLFPGLPAPHPSPPVRLPTDIRVRCGTATHTVQMREGRIVIPHTDEEVRRERALIALGGARIGCLAAQDGWRDSTIRMPRAMRRLRDEVMLLAQRGDVWALRAAVESGLDRHARDAQGRTLRDRLAWTGTSI
ncbi:hypothetical protein ACQP1P_01455 [Dactylosporangium sp. CA-052675]|uniref:hypothetical protein n=1 Tax=Dactylosporangium sp. CA-052675 TaxID=3239927 RepID=UPI003D930CCA